MLKNILACCLAVFSLSASLAHAAEADIRKAVAALYGANARVDAVRKAEALNLYEVRIGGDIFYSDEKGTYFVQGDIIDVNARQNITEARKNKLAQIKFADLPLEMAVKTVRGNGKRIFATFEDPNCGYCKKLAKDMAGMTDYTMYTFLYPILSADSGEKSKAIWCAADRAKAWSEWMVNDSAPTAANCATPTERWRGLGRNINGGGTPTIFFTMGERIPGALPAAQLEKELNRVASAK